MASYCRSDLSGRYTYFEAIDLMVTVIDQRFDQPSFDTYARMESLLVKALNSQDDSAELQFMETVYGDGVDIEMLTAQMEILKVLLKDSDFLCFAGTAQGEGLRGL